MEAVIAVLVGGPCDGEEMAVRNGLCEILYHVANELSWDIGTPHPDDAIITFRVEAYRFVGVDVKGRSVFTWQGKR